MSKALPVIAYEIVDHGIDGVDYFPGCGVAFTEFEHCVTGHGNDFAEALDDCLEQIAMCPEWDADNLEDRILADNGWTEFPESACVSSENEFACYYVSIRFR